MQRIDRLNLLKASLTALALGFAPTALSKPRAGHGTLDTKRSLQPDIAQRSKRAPIMAPKFSFGALYYRAPTPAPECWETDLKRMKALGFNTVKF